MSPTQSCLSAATIVALAYLAETLYVPVVGQIAAGFGQPDVAGYAFISAAFYGSAASGLLILVLANRWCLERCVSVALVAAPALNLLALASDTWDVAIALRFGVGLCSGIAVGAVVIGFAQLTSRARLAGTLSLSFSLAFLGLVPVMAVVPHIVDRFGTMAPAGGHLLVCGAVALIVRGTTFLPYRVAGSALRGIVATLPRVFWSGRKSLAFLLHATSLACAYIVLFGIQPALDSAGFDSRRIGLALAALSAATCAGGLLHAGLAQGTGIAKARWIVIAWGTVALALASACIATGGETALFTAILLLAGLGILGGPPTFEAMLYDLGPVDAVAGGLQRSLGMGLATALSTSALGIAVHYGLDIVVVLVLFLSVAYIGKIVCFLVLRRAEIARDPALRGSGDAGLPASPGRPAKEGL